MATACGESDCAGLIYAYFKDIGAEAGCYGGASSQVKYNCVFSGDVDELYGIPRIHGLVITMPDYNDPSTGIYSHIGIYVGEQHGRGQQRLRHQYAL